MGFYAQVLAFRWEWDMENSQYLFCNLLGIGDWARDKFVLGWDLGPCE